MLLGNDLEDIALDKADDRPDHLLRIGKVEVPRILTAFGIVADDDGERRRRSILLRCDDIGVEEPAAEDDGGDDDEKDDVPPQGGKNVVQADGGLPFRCFVLHSDVFFHSLPSIVIL